MNGTYLERLGIPVLDFLNGRHFAESIRQLAQILDSMCQADGELLGEELRCTEESAWTLVSWDLSEAMESMTVAVKSSDQPE